MSSAYQQIELALRCLSTYCIHGGQWVVKDDDISVMIESSRNVDTLFLSAGEVDTSLANLTEVGRFCFSTFTRGVVEMGLANLS